MPLHHLTHLLITLIPKQKNLSSDTLAINADKDKIDKNKQWLKVRSDDIYIDQSVKVLNKIITQNNLAKSN